MGIKHWPARAATAIGTLALAVSGSAPAVAESVTYEFDSSPYVRSVTVNNSDSAVVVRVVARSTPDSVAFLGWNVNIDSVAGHSTDFGAGEFTAYGPWKRSGIRLFSNADDGSYATTRVSCDGLRTARDGRVKTIVIPHSCLVYADAVAAAVRVNAVAYGTRTKPSGIECWGVSAPRRGWTDWLDPGAPPARMAGRADNGIAARGC